MRDGMLVVAKPQGSTSHDVVQLLRRRLGVKRIGHTGTLDPIAEGVLILLVGQATKFQQQLQSQRKSYDAAIRLGAQTDTGDAWGRTVRTAVVPPIGRRQAEGLLRALIGPLTQVPPRFSAVKVRGHPLYWWARRGEAVDAKPRTVEIYDAHLLDLAPDRLSCRIDCSSGTYIRSLAELLAERLGTVGHVAQLTRRAVGSWTLERAVDTAWLSRAPLEEIQSAIRPVVLSDVVEPLSRPGVPVLGSTASSPRSEKEPY